MLSFLVRSFVCKSVDGSVAAAASILPSTRPSNQANRPNDTHDTATQLVKIASSENHPRTASACTSLPDKMAADRKFTATDAVRPMQSSRRNRGASCRPPKRSAKRGLRYGGQSHKEPVQERQGIASHSGTASVSVSGTRTKNESRHPHNEAKISQPPARRVLRFIHRPPAFIAMTMPTG